MEDLCRVVHLVPTLRYTACAEPWASSWRGRIPEGKSPMLPGRETRLAGYLGGGGWRVGHEQAEQMLPARGKTRQGVTVGLLLPVDALKRSQPGHLGEVSGVAFRKLEVLENRRDKRGVVIDQALPRLPVPARGALHQSRNV